MRRRRLFLFAVVFLLGYGLLCGAGAVFVAEAALHPGRRALRESDREQALLMAERHDAHLTDVEVAGAHGISFELGSSGRGTTIITS